MCGNTERRETREKWEKAKEKQRERETQRQRERERERVWYHRLPEASIAHWLQDRDG
jgi:hypothetical protein